ncbi:MAG: hypothetical protein LE169_04455 [Endomicrobium sp.]|nr:hypothetical protein [Endomicrobium sp.]
MFTKKEAESAFSSGSQKKKKPNDELNENKDDQTLDKSDLIPKTPKKRSKIKRKKTKNSLGDQSESEYVSENEEEEKQSEFET